MGAGGSILTIALLLASASVAADQNRSRAALRYVNNPCGYTFYYPAQWKIDTEQTDGCKVTLRPRKPQPAAPLAATVTVTGMNRDFQAAASQAGFTQRRQLWAAEGPHGMRYSAVPLRSRYWEGLRASVGKPCGDAREGAHPERLCLVTRTLVSRNGRSAVIESDQQAAEAYERILRSFIFLN